MSQDSISLDIISDDQVSLKQKIHHQNYLFIQLKRQDDIDRSLLGKN